MISLPAVTGFWIKSSQTKVWLLFMLQLFTDKNIIILPKIKRDIEDEK